LLAYAYTGSTRWDSLKAFFLTLATEYNPSIPFNALRHAIIASAAHALPTEQFNEMKIRHQELGWKTLSAKLDSSAVLSDFDHFAASILADMTWDSNPTFPSSLKIVQRSLRALRSAQKEEGRRQRSKIFEIFSPYFIDGLRFCEMTGLTLTAGPLDWSLPQRTSFRECCRYYQEFRRVQSDLCDGVTEAVFDTLQEILHALICCAYRVVMGEMTVGMEWNRSVVDAMQIIRNDLCNPEFEKGIKDVINLYSSTSTEDATVNKGPSVSISILLDCIHLLFTILENCPIISSLNDLDITSKGKSILVSILRPGVDDFHIRSLDGAYEGCLLLVAMTLSSGDMQDREYNFCICINVVVIQSDIIEELKQRSQEKAGLALMSF
jgi:hypothetical protein